MTTVENTYTTEQLEQMLAAAKKKAAAEKNASKKKYEAARDNAVESLFEGGCPKIPRRPLFYFISNLVSFGHGMV
ncbi:hypothetical protein [Pedobacter sp. MW01-1-1]|uniref:hypothetical protein n=1 Tax=Pedobacter sp. MW01-1-1 TaxID=3383027 RepID=UPI003FF0AE60